MTAPTKLHIDTLREMFAVCANERRMKEADALAAAIAAIAPPSGEGVDDALVRQSVARGWCAPESINRIAQTDDAMPVATVATLTHPELADKDSGPFFTAQDWAALRHLPGGTKLYTTPQSAPEDGELSRIGELIRTQDNRITDQPIFIVQQKRVHVADQDYDHDGIVWVNDDNQEGGEAEHARLEAAFPVEGEPCGWRRLAVSYEWEFVTACFTEQGCKDYIARDGHNLKEPRIYAAGSYRNAEWRTVRNYLAGLATPPPASQERGVRCDAIPKHDWEILSVEANEYAPDLEGGWKRCKVCGTRCHFTRDASPPSSAAEASINPPEIDSKLIPDAAEKAKPDGYAAYRHSTHHVHRGPAQGYKEPESLPCYCTATMDHAIGHEDRAPRSQQWLEDASEDAQPVAEQAQAGELQEEIQWAMNGLPQLAVNLRYEEQTSRAETIERIVALLRRLAGGVTDEMVLRALCSQYGVESANDISAFHPENVAMMRAALVAALGAK